MTTYNYNGKEYPCLEHMKEIKATSNGELFGKFYNKKQMFNFFLGKDIFVEEGEGRTEKKIKTVAGDWGKYSGKYVRVGGWDGYVEIYKAENVTEIPYDLEPGIPEELYFLMSYFVKDDSGQVWLITTDVD